MTPDQLLAEPAGALPTLRSAVTGLPAYVPGRRSAGADIEALASNESHYEPLPRLQWRYSSENRPLFAFARDTFSSTAGRRHNVSIQRSLHP